MRILTHAELNELQTNAELLVLACQSTRSGWTPGPVLIEDLAKRIATAVIPEDLKEVL